MSAAEQYGGKPGGPCDHASAISSRKLPTSSVTGGTARKRDSRGRFRVKPNCAGCAQAQDDEREQCGSHLFKDSYLNQINNQQD
jgi:hypothetical protein